MPTEDVSLTFDNSAFTKGFQDIEKRMRAMQGVGEKIGKGLTFAFAKAQIAVAALGAAFRFVRGVIDAQMPEIGVTFGLVKDIFFRNFLFPLRQALLPLLQKVLDWTRTHRALFVQWGQVAVGIFRVVGTVVRGAIELFNRFWTAVRGTFMQIFGMHTRTFMEAVNMVLFKIAVVANAVMVLLGPVIDAVAGLIKDILPGLAAVVSAIAKIGWAAISGFIEGAAKNFPLLKTAIHDFVTELGRLFSTAAGKTALAVIKETFTVIGAVVTAALATQINLVVDALRALNDVIDWLSGKKVDWGNLLGPLKNILDAWGNVPGVPQAVGAVKKAAGAVGGAAKATAGVATAVTKKAVSVAAGAPAFVAKEAGDVFHSVFNFVINTTGGVKEEDARMIANKVRLAWLDAMMRSGR